MLTLVLTLAIRFLQSCVWASLVAGWLGANPDHPAVRRLRAIAAPLLELVRPLARRLPGSLEWASTVLVYLGLDLIRLLIGG